MECRHAEQSRWFVDEVLPHEADLRTWLLGRYPLVGETEIDDIVQEAFSRILKSHASDPIVNPRAFLFVTARNLALNQIRRFRKEQSTESDSPSPLAIADGANTPFESVALDEELKCLVDAIKELPERCQQIMILRKIYGFSQKEVAAKLDLSVRTVEAQIAIGLKKCAAYFRRNGYLRRFKK